MNAIAGLAAVAARALQLALTDTPLARGERTAEPPQPQPRAAAPPAAGGAPPPAPVADPRAQTAAVPAPARAPLAPRPQVAAGLETLYRREAEAAAAESGPAQGEPEAERAALLQVSPRDIERLAREHGGPQARAIPLAMLAALDPHSTLAIRCDPQAPDGTEPEPAHRWSARIDLALPRLGRIVLLVSVHEELARVSARAKESASRSELAAAAPALAAALARNALVLERMEVRADDG